MFTIIKIWIYAHIWLSLVFKTMSDIVTDLITFDILTQQATSKIRYFCYDLNLLDSFLPTCSLKNTHRKIFAISLMHQFASSACSQVWETLHNACQVALLIKYEYLPLHWQCCFLFVSFFAIFFFLFYCFV